MINPFKSFLTHGPLDQTSSTENECFVNKNYARSNLGSALARIDLILLKYLW